MLRIPSPRLSRLGACALAVLLVTACQNVPKYKRSSGKWDEWGSYEGKNFKPSNGVVVAIDATGSSVTIRKGQVDKVYAVTADTRIMHEGTDIPLAEFPLNQPAKFSVSEDGSHLRSLWYGHHLYEAPSLIHRRSNSGPL